MNILSIQNVSKIGRESPLFTGVTFGMNESEKAAIIGRNGTGKSTLLATIAGTLTPDEGTIVLNKSSGVSYLPQNPLFNAESTIRDHIFSAHDSPKLQTIREYEEVCAQMATESEIPAGIQQRFDQLTVQMDKGTLWNYEAQVRSILSTLGITDMTRKMGTLSGGMVKKVALAQVLVEDTKLLLLDEPTNHLDITTIHWLQNYLHDTQRTVLMVTHDRYFLDAVCTNIYELSRGSLKLYQGNYSTYLEKKEIEAQIETNTERRLESVLRFERDWLLRGPCARGTKAKARIQHDRQLIDKSQFIRTQNTTKSFQFEVAGRRLGGKILELHDISKHFPKGYVGEVSPSLQPASQSSATPSPKGDTPLKSPVPVLSNFSYTFSKGEKIGIFGDNGSGKTTLLNIITGAIPPDSGEIITGVNTVFGYYQQNPHFADLSLTVLEYIKEAAEVITMNDGKTLSAAQFLNEFGFEGKIQHSPLSTLSGGERKRVFLVRLLMSNPNFLILDEPTNDFDIFTMNILEDFLLGYKGCLLLVSHDRYFMDKIADTLFILEEDGSVSGFVGKCSEYLEYREEKQKQEAAQQKNSPGKQSSPKPTAATSPAQQSAAPSKPRKLTFKEQREFEQLEAQIAQLESKLPALEAAMSDPDYTKAQSAGAEYTAIQTQLEQAYARWEELAV